MNLTRHATSPTRALPKVQGGSGNPSRHGVVWYLAAMIVCGAIGNVFWLTRHWLTIPPPWDQAFYLYMGLRYLHALSDGGPLALIREFIHLSPDVAPLFPLTTVPLYLLFGPSQLVAYLTNISYLALLLSGVYLLGAHMYSRRAGVLAAFVAATFTATVNYSRDYLLEFPSAALISLGMYAFVRSETFRHRPWCLAFGALAGLSMLTKTMAGVFFITPVLYGFGCLVAQRQLTSARLRNFLLSVGMGGVVAAVWWGPNFRTAFGYLFYYGFQTGSVPYSKGGAEILSLKNLSYYALALMNYGTSFLYALLFGGLMLSRGVQGVLRSDRRTSEKAQVARQEGLLWAWLLVGYAILTIVPNKGEERYAQPLLPSIALLLAGSIDTITRQRLRRVIVIATVVLGGLNYIGLTYGLPLIPLRVYAHPVVLISHEYPHYTWVRNKTPRTSDRPWPISDILSVLTDLADKHRAKVLADLRSRFLDPMPGRSIEEDVRMISRVVLGREPDKGGFQKYSAALREGRLSRTALIETLIATAEFKHRRSRVLAIPDHPQFNASTLRYYAEVDRYALSFFHILDGSIDAERLQLYEFVLVKDGGYQGPEFSTQQNDQIQEQLLRPAPGFVPLPQSFACPDQSNIVIFAARSVLN